MSIFTSRPLGIDKLTDQNEMSLSEELPTILKIEEFSRENLCRREMRAPNAFLSETQIELLTAKIVHIPFLST